MPFFQFRRDTWCQECFKEARRQKGLDKLTTILNGRGIEIVSGEYVNSRSLFVVKCSIGHEWETDLCRVHANKGCPICDQPGKVSRQRMLSILQSIFPGQDIKVNVRSFKWLVGPNGGRMELDFYLPSLCLAIEYDGRQHFQPVNWNGDWELAHKEFQLVQQRDALKDHLISLHRNIIHHFVRVPFTMELTEANLIDLFRQQCII
jgi:hypothetical protein